MFLGVCRSFTALLHYIPIPVLGKERYIAPDDSPAVVDMTLKKMQWFCNTPAKIAIV
jgi:hypothetical protein